MTAAFTNNVGTFTRLGNEGVTTYTYNKNGGQTGVFTNGTSPVVNASSKSATVRTHVSKIDGVLPWRGPTDYYRMAANLSFEDGVYKTVFNPVTGWKEYYGCQADRSYEYLNPSSYNQTLGVLFTNEYNKCIVECLLKLGDQKAALLQSMAESVRAASQLTETAIEMLLWLRKAKNGQLPFLLNGNKAQNLNFFVNRIARTHLEWKYGWLPLASDLWDQFGVLKNGIQKPLLLRAAREVKSSTSATGDNSFTSHKDAQWICSITDRCVIWARVVDPNLVKAQALGLANPASLAWEVIPYSFVVDWFMPIGNILAALSACKGLSFVAGYSSQKREITINANCSLVGSVSKEGMVFARKKMTAFPSSLKPYANSNPFRTARLATMFSLLWQVR